MFLSGTPKRKLMCNLPDWLPDLLLFDDFGGDWQRYEDELFARFYSDFIESRPTFQGEPVFITKYPLKKGKERGFWHCIQEGDIEDDRTPDLRRCERICWIRPVIEHTTDPKIKKWPTQRKGKNRYLLWVEDADYLVILEKRPGSWYLWTTYYTDRERTRNKLREECEAYIKSQRRPV
jgi:hypothetical protein